jgi:hypothetical protein
MPAQLQEIREQLAVASERARVLVESLTAEELTRRAAGRWSAAECLAHLTRTTEAYLPLLDAAALEASLGHEPYELDFVGRMLAWMLEPPYRMVVAAPPHLVPGVDDPAALLPDFLAAQDALFARIEIFTGLAIDKVKIASPVDSRVKYNAYSALRVIAAHQRRHLWQAEEAAAQASELAIAS